jgi:hypothetical protein
MSAVTRTFCALWFWKGETVVGKKPKEAMGNFGRITNVKDLPPAARLEAFLLSWPEGAYQSAAPPGG